MDWFNEAVNKINKVPTCPRCSCMHQFCMWVWNLARQESIEWSIHDLRIYEQNAYRLTLSPLAHSCHHLLNNRAGQFVESGGVKKKVFWNWTLVNWNILSHKSTVIEYFIQHWLGQRIPRECGSFLLSRLYAWASWWGSSLIHWIHTFGTTTLDTYKLYDVSRTSQHCENLILHVESLCILHHPSTMS